MSNPTELLDLDRGYVGRKLAIITRDLSHYTAQEMARELVRLAKVADESEAIKEARRTQPEGEAPQAVAQVYLDMDNWMDVAISDVPTWARKGFKTRTLYTAPAAQHAESGAPAGKLGEVIALLRQIEDCPDDGEPWVIAGKARLLVEFLAAQSQGALFDADLSFAAHLGEPGAVAEMARRRAQQAAAPGALDLLNAEELAALHRFQETCEDSEGYDVGKDMMKRLAAIGVIESKGFNRYQFTEFGDYVVENRAPSAPGTPEAPQTAAARDVLAERQRQMEVEGWTPEHDDMHGDGQMAVAAGYFALASGSPYERSLGRGHMPIYWPWAPSWWKPRAKRENLVRAGALVLAEIERLDRAAQLDGGQGGGASHE